jgi:hypothetical protein
MARHSSEQSIFERALEVAERRLLEKRRELSKLSGEIGNLRQVVNGLRGALGMEPEETEATSTGQWYNLSGTSDLLAQLNDAWQVVAKSELTTNVPVAASGDDHGEDGGKADREPRMKVARARRPRRPVPRSTSSSTVRAAAVVNEMGLPLTLGEIYEQFQNRGWVEDGWQAPEAAVAQAVRRAERAGLIARLNRRHYAPVGSLADEPPVGDDGESARLNEEVRPDEEARKS